MPPPEPGPPPPVADARPAGATPTPARLALRRRRDEDSGRETLIATLSQVCEHWISVAARRRALAGDARAGRLALAELAEARSEKAPEQELSWPDWGEGGWSGHLARELAKRGCIVDAPDLSNVPVTSFNWGMRDGIINGSEDDTEWLSRVANGFR